MLDIFALPVCLSRHNLVAGCTCPRLVTQYACLRSRIINPCESIVQACENWASALLLHLLSDCSTSDDSPLSTFEAEVNNRTAELAQLLLRLQCSPAHKRPALAAALRQEVTSSLDQLAQVQLHNSEPGHRGAPMHDRAQKAVTRGDRQGRREATSSGVEMDSSSDELPASLKGVRAADDDDAVSHGLRMTASFPVEANYTNKWMNEYFLLNEPSAARTVRSCVPSPAKGSPLTSRQQLSCI